VLLPQLLAQDLPDAGDRVVDGLLGADPFGGDAVDRLGRSSVRAARRTFSRKCAGLLEFVNPEAERRPLWARRSEHEDR
jgi:hypothetical protein